jgi:hypothetical protein
MQLRYFVNHQGAHAGPLTFAEIETRLNANEFFPTDYVYVSERGDWIPILEFIMIHGPKEKILRPVLQTVGARHPDDESIDWRRFALGLPATGTALKPLTGDAATFYPARPTAPVPAPKKAEAQRTVTENPVPPQVPATGTEPAARTPRKPVVRPRTRSAPKVIDTSAVACVEVMPANATRLTIEITGTAMVGEDLQILVAAQAENGALDTAFNDVLHLLCDRPLEGLAPLKFERGVAKLTVRCLTQGAHQFTLSDVLPEQGSARPGPVPVLDADENHSGLIH